MTSAVTQIRTILMVLATTSVKTIIIPRKGESISTMLMKGVLLANGHHSTLKLPLNSAGVGKCKSKSISRSKKPLKWSFEVSNQSRYGMQYGNRNAKYKISRGDPV